MNAKLICGPKAQGWKGESGEGFLQPTCPQENAVTPALKSCCTYGGTVLMARLTTGQTGH